MVEEQYGSDRFHYRLLLPRVSSVATARRGISPPFVDPLLAVFSAPEGLSLHVCPSATGFLLWTIYMYSLPLVTPHLRAGLYLEGFLRDKALSSHVLKHSCVKPAGKSAHEMETKCSAHTVTVDPDC